jgi:hypothetical protein
LPKNKERYIMSRPKGSKNKTKNIEVIPVVDTSEIKPGQEPRQEPGQVIKRGRGRPRGTGKIQKTITEVINNPVSEPVISNINIKDLKSEIRQLKKLKLQCRPGSAERLDLEHKIKDLKKQRTGVITVEPEKEKLIEEIKKADPLFERLEINLNKFTVIELQKHIEYTKRKQELDK